MGLWIWRNCRLEVPDDWEMLQFSPDPQAGRCAFADRYGFRLELDWRAVEGPPDFQRMMSDYAAKLRLDGSMPDAALTRVAGWHGVEGRQDGLLASRHGRTLEAEGCLVEVVLLWPGEKDAELERRVLASVAAEPERAGRFRRWRAFGMDLLASKGLALGECSVQPASARMVFADARSRRREAFQRLGMVPEWLEGSVREWLNNLPKVTNLREVDSTGSTEEQGHLVETIRGFRRPRGLGGLLGQRSFFETSAWICPADGRLYQVTLEGGEPEAATGRRLSCCEDLELAT